MLALGVATPSAGVEDRQDSRENSIPDAVVNVGSEPSRVSVLARPDLADCCRSTSLFKGANLS